MGEMVDRIDKLLAHDGGAMLSEHRRALAHKIMAEIRNPTAAMLAASGEHNTMRATERWQAMVDTELTDKPAAGSGPGEDQPPDRDRDRD